ncbi:SAM-dependent methyltransferase [Nocardioides sp. YIM 152588]|uniref:SAM-dependent methyltransferase n=1 Tax=Nocardioides sp. YIM 152588 TaxID=3158259 RepID=UPI0032E3FCE2
MTQAPAERLHLADLVEEDHDHDHEEYDRHSVPGRLPAGEASGQGWYSWHAPYDDLESEQNDRLELVQEELVAFFDAAAAGPLHALSICAGQARDLLPILIHHPRGADTRATMVELDRLNASFLHGALGSTALVDVEVVVADAGHTDAYRDRPPADLVLLCGVFANVEVADAERTVGLLPALCAPGATVVWTSYGDGLAEIDAVVAAFEDGPFELVGLTRGPSYVVGGHRFTGEPAALPANTRIFSFRARGDEAEGSASDDQ